MSFNHSQLNQLYIGTLRTQITITLKNLCFHNRFNHIKFQIILIITLKNLHHQSIKSLSSPIKISQH
jgi:hypothetical protein